MKVGVCEGRVKTVAMGAQRVINLDNIGDGSFELKRDKGVANPEGLICENSCEEKYTLGTLMGCEKQLTVDRESFRNHTIAKIAGQGGEENTCKADVRKCLKDGLAMRLPLSEPREIYKDSLETDNGSNIGSECSFEIDLPGKRDRSTVYRLNLIKLYRRKPELENLVMKNSSEGIDSETLYSVKLFMDFGFQDVNSLREDTEYLLDLGVNGMGQSNRTLPVVWLGRVNRYPYPRIKCIKYGNLNQPIEVPRMVDIDILMEIWKNRVKKIDFVLKWLSRVGSEVGPTKGDERRPEKEKKRRRPEKEKKKRGGDPKGEVEEKSSEKTRAGRLRKRRGESQSVVP
ncbi:uncharacterized protein TNCV_2764401 [Trichonephila clavipes]|nr:uncharacterized protein TNCV_2764401 [Trichonephila clavipes]